MPTNWAALIGNAAQWTAVLLAIALGIYNALKQRQDEGFQLDKENYDIRPVRRRFWMAIRTAQPNIDKLLKDSGPCPWPAVGTPLDRGLIDKQSSPSHESLLQLANRLSDELDNDRAGLSYFHVRGIKLLGVRRAAKMLADHDEEIALLTWFELVAAARAYHGRACPKPGLYDLLDRMKGGQ